MNLFDIMLVTGTVNHSHSQSQSKSVTVSQSHSQLHNCKAEALLVAVETSISYRIEQILFYRSFGITTTFKHTASKQTIIKCFKP